MSCPSLDLTVSVRGRSILHFAALFEDIEALDVIRSSPLTGVDTTTGDNSGKSAMQLAYWRRDHKLKWLHQVKT